MAFLGKWMELEMIMLTKIIQNQKDKCHVLCVWTCMWIRKLEIVHEREEEILKERNWML